MKKNENKIYDLKTSFGEYKVTPMVYSYHYGGGIAIELIEVKEGEPFACLTVNLPSYSHKENCAFVDTNNCSWAIDFLEEHKLAKPTGFMGMSGFCIYPEYEFDISKMQDKRD
jgi:hypothetical protein